MKRALVLPLVLAILSAQATSTPKSIRGQTEPAARVEVPAGMKGQLLSVNVMQGQIVKKGDVLARLDDSIQKEIVALARLHAESTVEIRYAQNAEEYARAENERWKNSAAATDLEKRQKALAVSQAALALEQYKEKQKQAQVALRKEELVLERMTIKSPIDGFILKISKHAGEETDDSPLVVVVQVNKLAAVFYPPRELFGKVKVGDKITLELATDPPLQRQATVITVDPIIDPASQLFQVRMELDNTDNQIPAGTAATWPIVPRP